MSKYICSIPENRKDLKISELIALLKKARNEHGDLLVVLEVFAGDANARVLQIYDDKVRIHPYYE